MKLDPINLTRYCRNRIRDAKIGRLVNSYDFAGYKRIYHYHIRKTGGTSMARMFMSLNGNDAQEIWDRLENFNDQLCIRNGLIYTGWYQPLLESGHYFYGFSHLTFDQFQIPENSLTFTCFRDPMSRVISHYRMLRDMVARNSQHPCMKTESKWLGSSFDDFLTRIPREHLENQLYMFSERFDVDEATDRVCSLNLSMFTEQFDDGVEKLNKLAGLNLVSTHQHRSSHAIDLSTSQQNRLREMLTHEYSFLALVRNQMSAVAA